MRSMIGESCAAALGTVCLIVCLAAGTCFAQQYMSPGDFELPAGLRDPAAVAAAGLRGGSAWLEEADETGTLGPARRIASWRFDESGNILEHATFARDGAPEQRVSYRYHSGLLIETQNDGTPGVGSFLTEFRYDPSNRLVSSESIRPDGSLIVRTTYRYNDRGEMVELSTEADSEAAAKRITIAYNPSGKAVETIVLDAGGAVQSRTLSTYDAAGNLLEQSSYAPDDRAISTAKHEYDSDGRLVRTTALSAAGETINVASNRYDGENRIVESSTENPMADISSRTVYTYDPRGMLIRADTFNKLGQLASRMAYSYEYAEAKGEPVPRQE